MTSAFSITTASTHLTIEGVAPGTIVFTVKNTTGQAITGRGSLVMIPSDGEHSSWLQLRASELSERRFPVDGVETYTVEVDIVPPETLSGDYFFHLDMVSTDNPDETYTAGPAVVLSIIRPEPVPERRPFPWWIVIAVGAALLVAGIVTAVVLLNQHPELAVTVVPESSSVLAGASASYTLTIANTGKSAEDVWVFLDAPKGASLKDYDHERCKGDDKRINCQFGNLKKDTEVQLKFFVDIDKEQSSDIRMPAAVSAANLQEEQDCSFDVSVIGLKEGLSVRIIQPSENRLFLTGSKTTFRISVRNNHEETVDGVTLAYSLPDGVDFDISAQNRVVNVRSCLTEEARREVSCSIGQLSNGKEATIEIHVIPNQSRKNSEHVFVVNSPNFKEVQAVYTMEEIVEKNVCKTGCKFTSVKDAVAAATDGDKIGIGAGVYMEPIPIDKDITLVGEYTGDTILDGNYQTRLIWVEKDKQVVLRQLIVQRGQAPTGEYGGGILNLGTLTLQDVVVRANKAGDGGRGRNASIGSSSTAGGGGGHGGGIANAGILQLMNIIVEHNTAGAGGRGGNASNWGYHGATGGKGGEGGGIWNSPEAEMKLIDSIIIITNNCAGSGGAGGSGSTLYGGGNLGVSGEYANIYNTDKGDMNKCPIDPTIIPFDLNNYPNIFDLRATP